MYFEIYPSGGLINMQWRWRLRAANNRIIADSGESYHNKTDCIHALNLVKTTNIFTPVKYKF